MRLVAALLLALHAGAASAAKGGGGVKEIRSKSQFDTLLKYHKISTGLPVVVDYYSDSCGPCRMMEPIYKGMAKEYDGRAVFVKVNVQTTNVGQQIRSMPTFQFWLNGKKMEEFSGGDEGSLRRITADLAKKARQMNMEITAENLFEFYKEHDKSKTVRAAAPFSPIPALTRTSGLTVAVRATPTAGRLPEAAVARHPGRQARAVAQAKIQCQAEDDRQGPQEEEEEGREGQVCRRVGPA